MTKKVKSKVLEIMALALEFNGRSTKCECTAMLSTVQGYNMKSINIIISLIL